MQNIGRSTGSVLGCVALALTVACSSGGGGGSAGPPEFSEDGLSAPSGVTVTSSNGQVLVDWNEVTGADSYYVYWDDEPGFDPATLPGSQSKPVGAPPTRIGGLVGDVHVVVTSVTEEGQGEPSNEATEPVALATPFRYFPTWADKEPENVIVFDYDGGQSQEANGSALASMILSLQPGDRLEIGTGTYMLTNALRISLVGTADRPIWIAAQEGARPVLTRQGNNQNGVEFGTSGPARHVIVQGIEIEGGDIGLRLHNCENLWFDRCEVHHTANNAIAANSHDTEYITFTRCEVHHTSGYGEGFYVGANNGDYVARYWTLAMNYVHDCGGHQGDGIEVKQGSYGNWIAENTVHDTNYPCILVYGTGGKQQNVIERNLLYRSNNETMQVQGEAIVRNNIVLDGTTAFYSGDHQGTVTRLEVVHNTFVNDGPAVTLNQWSGKNGMIFANNACYSENSAAFRFGNGSDGVTVRGNVAYGYVNGTNSGYTLGGGLSDFVDLSTNGNRRNARPSALGALVASADDAHGTMEDQKGDLRLPPLDVGALDEN